MSLLETNHLTKEFGGLVAVDHVNMHIEEDERLSIIGPNGAGKTTLLNLITGMLPPTEGEVVFRGKSITGLAPHAVVQHGISKSFQTASIFPELSVEDNARIAALAAEHGAFKFNFLRHRDRYAEIDERTVDTLDAVGLLEYRESPAQDLSYGDKRRLEIGIALASEPDLLLMDEPTAGMSPEETSKTVDLIEELKEEFGLTIVLIEHDMEVVFSIANRIIVLNRGQVIAEGPPDEVQGDTDVQEAYLGGFEA